LRNRALRSAALNAVIGKRMATVLEGLGVSPDRMRVIPNWADGSLMRPVRPEENSLRRGWGLSNCVVVGYSGNLGRAHEAETMLEAIALIEAEGVVEAGSLPLVMGARLMLRPAPATPIAWLFIGGGAQFERLRAECGRRGYLNVHFQPYQPRAQLAESLSVPDVHLISLRPELEGLIVPSKYYGIAAAGRPAIFIGDPDGEIGRILAETGTGLTVAEGDGAGLARAVRTLAEDPRRAADMGRRARAHFETQYDVRFAVDAWDEAIRALRP
jgi:glycosyltransferase involved in cell wall biosynthesis